MSRYSKRPLEFTGLHTVRLEERGGKVKTADFASLYRKGSGMEAWLDSLPSILAGVDFPKVVDAIFAARARKRAIIWGLGGHVIKCGLAPVLIDLMRRGYATVFALNGAAAIHDFEIALAGHTSEDVQAALPDGREMNAAVADGARDDLGIGEALGRRLETAADPAWAPFSLVLQAYRAAVPVTVHVAMGTDTPHVHPDADGAAIGGGSHRDFRLLCSYLADLGDGGVYLNVGSAVLLPEVFLKAISALRNLGHALSGFTTANFDFQQHYRPRMNVLERPHAGAGGAGYAITGHHELMIPLLAAALIEKDS